MDSTPETTPEHNTPPPVRRRGLLGSGLIVSAMTFISRILGLARDIVIASLVGAGGAADAFFVAFKIPNFLRRLFAEGAFNQAFIPVLAEYAEKKTRAEIRRLIDAVAGCLGLSLIALTSLAMLASPLLVWLFAPGFASDPDKQALTADLLRITFPYLLLISLTAFSGSILNTWGRFAIPAITPVFLNLSLIGCALFLTPLIGSAAEALAWGVLIAGMVQLAFQLPFLAHAGLLPLPRPQWKHEGVRRILKLMTPALFGVSVSQINLLLDTILASFLTDGSVGWLYYADRLVELPLGVFGIAIATVILPTLSRQHATADAEKFSRLLDWAVRMVLLIGLPAAAALVILAEPLLITLFQYGAMTAHDVRMAALALQAYALGLLAFMLIKVLAPGYFARQDTRTPVRIGIKAMVANMVFNLLLIIPLAHAGLALATAASAFLNAYWLARGLRKEGVLHWSSGWGRYALQLLAALLMMVALLWWLSPESQTWLDWSLSERLLRMTLLVIGGAGLYAIALLAVGIRLRHLRHG
ncbi:murein biosynthesis integral membrane protein MurJ [Marinospirillum alkaliphilum]|uniref:Probable lipid II flippase MurJ n=1 Tax=Marinospirillum alkaliphilum DSM 21637 TaxID=1122209 RepID=A0A1K1XZK6_9GAMM|nr:murein biosynthesis integral membrane protein MurJ [Marinospirillum alkaliphilum]SFX54918.1 putative peptidoglycan lipid II flippase [Marinospirillum alkaliphilum DSM 21637]